MKKFIAIIACALSIMACTVTGQVNPVTPSERLVQAEGAYRAVAATFKGTLLNHSVSGENASRGFAALVAASVALDAWKLVPNDPNLEQKFLVSLQAVRALVQSFAPQPPNPVNYFKESLA